MIQDFSITLSSFSTLYMVLSMVYLHSFLVWFCQGKQYIIHEDSENWSQYGSLPHSSKKKRAARFIQFRSLDSICVTASLGVLFEIHSTSDYRKREIGTSPKDEFLFSFQ